MQLERFGLRGEQSFRNQFEKPFDFLSFNKELIHSNVDSRFVIAFDPSFINKAGKKTPGLGWYWSGCAGRTLRGLEFSGLAAIDLGNHTAFHLEAVQTLIDDRENTTLTDWYIQVVSQRQEQLKSISKYFVADAWFSKVDFVRQIRAMDLHLICRFRDDADLKYLFRGERTSSRGRPKKYDGKIDLKNLRKDYFEKVESEDDQTEVYSAIVFSKSLKMQVKLVHVTYKLTSGKKAHKLYYSTDTQMEALDILDCYKSRFQIEFLYRDAKQHTGLNDCQARSENKLHFHFNISLTAINVAKVEHWMCKSKEDRGAFSMADIKTLNNNKLLLDRFIDVFGVNPYSAKNKKRYDELLSYGTIAA